MLLTNMLQLRSFGFDPLMHLASRTRSNGNIPILNRTTNLIQFLNSILPVNHSSLQRLHILSRVCHSHCLSSPEWAARMASSPFFRLSALPRPLVLPTSPCLAFWTLSSDRPILAHTIARWGFPRWIHNISREAEVKDD
jgi:hypothetical protein